MFPCVHTSLAQLHFGQFIRFCKARARSQQTHREKPRYTCSSSPHLMLCIAMPPNNWRPGSEHAVKSSERIPLVNCVKLIDMSSQFLLPISLHIRGTSHECVVWLVTCRSSVQWRSWQRWFALSLADDGKQLWWRHTGRWSVATSRQLSPPTPPCLLIYFRPTDRRDFIPVKAEVIFCPAQASAL